MKERFRLLALVLVFSLLLGGCAVAMPGFNLDPLLEGGSQETDDPHTEFVGYEKPELEEGEAAFSDLEYVRPDLDAFSALVDEVCAKAAEGEGAVSLMRLLDKVYAAYDEFYTMDSLADIRYCLDMTDAYYRDEYQFCSENESFLEARLDDMYYALAATASAGKLESMYFGGGFFDGYRGEAEDSVWAKGFGELLSRESQLEAQYYEAVGDMLEKYGDITYNTDLYNAYYRDMEEQVGPILVELVKVRKQQAENLGYEDYESFAWDWYYGRDYSPADAAHQSEQVIRYLVPIYEKIWDKNSTYREFDTRANREDMVDYVASAAAAMGGDVKAAFDLMMRRELVDLEQSDNKYTGSFEVYLTSFQVPFVLVNPTGTILDVSTLAHEFGHFVNDYQVDGSYVSQDISEVFSQGMEYLCLAYADEDEFDMNLLRRVRMIDSLDTYVEQTAYYTFESALYQIPEEELTVERINELYAQVASRFGFDGIGWDTAEWVDVTHIFTEPFYIISYVMSNDAAMQLYQMERDDPGTGLDLFCEMANAWEDAGFVNFITEYGLENPLEEDRIPAIAALFKETLN